MTGAPVEARIRLALDEHLSVLSVEDGIEPLLGFCAADFLTSRVHLIDRIHADDADIADLLFAPHGDERSGVFNIRLRHADGKIRCVRGEFAAKKADSDGAFVLELLLQDAKSLWVSADGEPESAHFRALMESTDDFIFFKDRNHVFTTASQNMLAAVHPAEHGRTLLGQTDYDVFPEKYADIYYRLEKQVFAGVAVASEVHQSLKLDGSLAWFDNHKYPIRDGSKEIVGLFGVVRDITEHMEAGQALRDSEESLRESQRIAGLGTYVGDLASGNWTSSDILDQLFGIDQDYKRTLEGWAALIHPDDQAMMVAYMQNEILGRKKEFDKEYRIARHSDGVVRWIHDQGRLELDDQGRPVRMIGCVRDITKQKETEQAVRESEESLREAQNIAGIGSYVTDIIAGTWTSSEVMDKIFGIGKEYGRTVEGWGALVHPDDRAGMVRYFMDEVVGQRKPFDREYRILRQLDGEVRWVHGLGRLDFDAQGQPVKMHGTIRDIHERKQIELALRESEETLREAQRIAGLGSFVVKFGTGQWTASEVSDRLLGIDENYDRTVAGWKALIYSEDREMMDAHFVNEVLGKQQPYDKEFRVVRQSDGAVRWMHILGRVEFDSHGAPQTLRGTFQDITEHRQAEVALRESEESLREAQKIAGIGSFVTNLETGIAARSDEMNALFGIDRGYAESLEGWQALIHPDDRAMMAEHVASEVLGMGRPFDKEYRIVRQSDKAVRWMHAQGRLELDSLGKPLKIRGTIQDITERRQADVALRESKELLQLFITHAPAGLAMFDREMRYLAASNRWLLTHSLMDRDVIGLSQYEVFTGLPESWKGEHRRALAGETLPADERYLALPNGWSRWIRREIIPWRTGDGEVGGIIIFSDDITRQKESEERLRLAASVFTNAREGIMITDPGGTILEVNDMFTRITGYSRKEAIGRNSRLLRSGLQSADFYAGMWHSLLEKGQWSGDIWNRNKSGEIFAETLAINAVHDVDGNLLQYVALFSDVTEIKEHERQLEHVTNYDLLTSLPNRALLIDRLRQAMTLPSQEDRLLAVAYLDLDGFKTINDSHGHEAGDRLLTSLAFNMKCALRKGDTLARIGGDEFVAVLLDLDDAEASTPVLNRLLEAAAEVVQVGELSLGVTVSIGVSFYPQKDDVDADSLLRQADQAMYQAKLAGGNRYHNFDPNHDQLERGRHENLEHIRQALAAHEFELYYQPKVNMRTGKVVGAEALIRWQHPVRGLLPPGMFLPVIEEHPLAIELGEWVIDTALAQIETWSAAGMEIPVSVNVGALQLQQEDFVDRLSSLLAAHPGVKPFNLELEVLETSALQDVVQTSQVLNACHGIGVSFALDDFGTGYSSLTYLKRLPASILKIDQSFVSDMLEDPENLNILEGILGLGSAFHRQVVAEGVETVEHGVMLLRLGCELAQGYGIARPMPARDLPGWVSSWRPDPRWCEVPPVHAGNRTLLYAFVEHRAWIAAFDAFLQGKRHSPPPLGQRQCRFGAWLDTEGQAGRGQHDAYRSVDATHRQLHALSAEIVASQAQGRNSEGIGRLGELHKLGDDLLEQLESLMQWC